MKVREGDCPLGAKCEEVKVDGGEQVIVRCPWYIKVRGFEPNTGLDIDEWRCAIAWTPILLINNSNEVRQGAAAIESFRNEVVKQNEVAMMAMKIQINKPHFKELPIGKPPALESAD